MTSPDHKTQVEQLQKQLASIEAKFEVLRKARNYAADQWDAIEKGAAAVRGQLFQLTGDSYGRPKVKLVKPSDEELEASYESADQIPSNVRAWIARNASLLTSDATDAVRLLRIADTLEDDRYPEGEITVYRAISLDCDPEIRPGDWVSTDLDYVLAHKRRYLGDRGVILEEVVDGLDVLVSPTGNLDEAIYAPRELSGPIDAPAAIDNDGDGARAAAPRM